MVKFADKNRKTLTLLKTDSIKCRMKSSLVHMNYVMICDLNLNLKYLYLNMYR